jgi:hypothetical protein
MRTVVSSRSLSGSLTLDGLLRRDKYCFDESRMVLLCGCWNQQME